MAGKSDALEAGYLDLLFLNIALTLVGNAGGLLPSSVAGSLYFSLHTADPTDAGTQSTSEVAYTSYARTAVARSGAGFSRSANAVSIVSPVTFPAGTGGSGTATFWGIGTDASGTGKLLYSGAISPSIVCGNGVTPQLAAGTAVTED